MSKKENIKPLRELNLMNRFLFSEAMEDPDNIITMLEIILDCKLSDIKNFQTEKEERIDTLSKTARLDLFVSDTDGTVYDVEAQIENTYNLPKRSRYYNATIDSHLIEVGDIDYNKLNDTYVIMICSFDLFHKGKYKYTFKMRCEEDDNLYLNDGATRIFLNTKGKNASEVSPSLIEFLKYMENTTEEMAESCVNPEIKKLHQRIEKIRSSEEVNIKYMKEWEEKKRAEEKALAEGEAKGMARMILDILKGKGNVPDFVQDRILSETNTDTLLALNRIVYGSASVEDFVAKAGFLTTQK